MESTDNDANPLILAVDKSADRLQILGEALRASGFDRIYLLSETTDLLEKVNSLCPDVILIEVESPGRDTLEQLSLIRDQHPTPVAMIAQDQEAQTIHAAVASGVCAYSVDGVSSEKVRPAIEVAMATFNSFKRLRGELAQAKEDLSRHKRINRAKNLLMQERGLSEDEAYKALQKLSMDRQRKLIDVADDVVAFSKFFLG